MAYRIERDLVSVVNRQRWWKVSSMQAQRQRLGLSLMCCAFLLNLHETSLLNLEIGAALPTADMLGRMQLLGFSADEGQNDTVILRLSELEHAAYRHVADLPVDRRRELSDDLTFYLSSKRWFDEEVRREAVLVAILAAAPLTGSRSAN
jgi:hypothetical protein